MRGSRNWNNSTRLHHLYNNICSNLLRVLAYFAGIPLVGVEAGLGEGQELEDETKDLAHGAVKLVLMRWLFPI
jgi:hypothetical protein